MKNLSLLILLLSSAAFAGGASVGNGGDAVVCRDGAGNIRTAEVLDVYEARVLREIHLIATGTTNLKDAFLALNERLKKVSPKRVGRYSDFVDFFINNARFVDAELVDVPDSEHLVFPAGCKVEQLVIQQVPATSYDAIFLVQKQVWNALSIDQQAVMLMHEALLRESIEMQKFYREEIETRALRFLNSAVFGSLNFSEKEWILSFLKLPNCELVESKFFGEVLVLRRHLREGGTTVQQLEFDANSELSGVVLNSRMLKSSILENEVYPLGRVRFKSPERYLTGPEDAEGVFRIRRITGTKSQIAISHFNYSVMPLTQADGTLLFDAFCCKVTWPEITLDTETLEIVEYTPFNSNVGVKLQKSGPAIDLSIGGVKLSFRDTYSGNYGDDAQVFVNTKWHKESTRRLLRYKIQRGGNWVDIKGTVVASNGQQSVLILDNKLHVLAFDLDGNPIPYIPNGPGPERVDFVDSDGKIVGGMYDSSRPIDLNFKPDAVAVYNNLYNDVTASIVWQPLPKKQSELRLITDEPLSVLMGKRSKIYIGDLIGKIHFRCETIAAGTEVSQIVRPISQWSKRFSSREWRPAGRLCKLGETESEDL